MKMRKMCIAFAACLVLALGVIATAEGPDAKTAALTRGTPIATEVIGPSSLSIQSRIDYSRAVLRISGPQGLQLSTAFGADEKVHVDLLKADWKRSRARKTRAEEAPKKTELSNPPNGRYRYEIHFFAKGAKTRYYSGQFFVENGAAVSRKTARSRQKETRADLAKPRRGQTRNDAQTSDGVPKYLATSTYLYLYPTAPYPPAANTWVTLGSYDIYTSAFETISLLNYQGDLVIGQGSLYGTGYPYDYFYPHMTIPRSYVGPYGAYSRVGIGTYTPYSTLDLSGPYFVSARLSAPYYGSTFQLEIYNGNFDIWDPNSSGYPITIEPGVPSGSYPIWIQNTGRVGSGTTTPTAPIDVEANATSIGFGNAVARLANSAGAVAFQLDADDDGTFWNFASISGDSSFRISRSGTGNTEMSLTSTGNLSVFGDLSIGGTCTGCDAVFQPGYSLESIEDHAALMWENSYLPAVGPTEEGRTRISVFKKTTGMLNELEKAHVYIEQLHNRLQQQEQAIENLTQRLAELEEASPAR